MAYLYSAAVRVAAPTAPGTQTITAAGVGTPKAAILVVVGATASGVARPDAILGLGFTDGAAQRYVSWQSESGQDTTNTDNWAGADALVQLIDQATNGQAGKAVFDGWVADGIRLDWTDAPPVAHLVTVLFLYGADMQAKVGDFSTPAVVGGGTVVTGVGFEADHVLCMGANREFNNTRSPHFWYTLGVASNLSPSENVGLGGQFRNFRPRGDVAALLGSTSLGSLVQANLDSPPTVSSGAKIDNYTSFGFRAQTTFAARSTHYAYLALEYGGGGFAAGIATTRTSLGVQTIATGFQPSTVLAVATTLDTELSDGDTDAGSLGIGVGTSKAQYSSTVREEDGAAPSNSQSLSESSFFSVGPSYGAAGYEATLEEFGAASWSLNYSVAPAIGRKFLWMAFGSPEEDAVEDGPLRNTVAVSRCIPGDQPTYESRARRVIAWGAGAHPVVGFLHKPFHHP